MNHILSLQGVEAQLPAGLEDITEYRFIERTGEPENPEMGVLAPSLVASVIPGEQTADDLATEFRQSIEGLVQNVTQQPGPHPESVEVVAEFQEKGELWRQKCAFLPLDSTTTLQVSTSGPANHPSLDEWYNQAVRGAHLAETIQGVRLRDAAVHKSSLPEQTVGRVQLPIPDDLQGPEALQLATENGAVRLSVSLQDSPSAKAVRFRGQGVSGTQPSITVEGSCLPGQEQELANAKQLIEEAFGLS